MVVAVLIPVADRRRLGVVEGAIAHLPVVVQAPAAKGPVDQPGTRVGAARNDRGGGVDADHDHRGRRVGG